ncbi:glycosyltransferase [Gordonia sp. DT218]|uniref:glycosyltransferase n=1 Tax=Gordonia sp. DT218 TaxID=3416659 RepID=UPI003CE91BBE
MSNGNKSLSITVAIIVFNTDEVLLQRCLESVRNQTGTHLANIEILVRDNSSNSKLRRRFENLCDRWLEGDNIGFGAAANRCVRDARNDWILLLNPDTEIQDGALEALARTAVARRSPNDIYVGWLRSRCAVQVDAMMCWLFSTARLLRRHRYSVVLRRSAGGAIIPVEKVSGGACFAHRGVLESLGPYDERFFLYGEDVDMSLRARQRGFNLLAVPTAAIFHDAASSQRDHSRLVERARADSAVRLSAYHLTYYGSILFRAEFLIVTLLGLVVPTQTSSHSREARFARLRVLRAWGLRKDLEKWAPNE